MAQGAERLVGRTGEVGQIEDALAELAEGRPAAIELVGEPGIGKTRLLAELARRADARGQLVLSGSASELERDLPFWVFVDALDDYVRGLEPDRLAGLADDVRGDLATVLPCLSAYASPHGIASHDERYRSYRAVRELLELLARTQQLVVLLDDLHWGDPASVELLGSLLNRPPAAPVLLAFAVRPRQMPERLPAAVERALRAGTASRLELGALSRDEAGELLGDGLGAADAAGLYTDSGGNPFYLQQLARMLDRAGAAPGPAPELSLERRAGSPDRRRGDRGGARPALGRGAPRARGGSRRGRSLRSRACRRSRRERRIRRHSAHWTSFCASIWCARPMCRGASASGIRSSAARSTRRRRAAGGSERTSAALRPCVRAAHRPLRAPTTSSAPPATATRPRSRRCARPALRPPSAHPPAPRAGSRRQLRLTPDDDAGRGAGRAAADVRRRARRERPLRGEPRHPHRMRRARARRCRRDACPGGRRPARASSGCSAATRRPAPASKPRSRKLEERGLAGGRRAHARARVRQPPAHGIRRDRRLGGTRGRSGASAWTIRCSRRRRSPCRRSPRPWSAPCPRPRRLCDGAAERIDGLRRRGGRSQPRQPRAPRDRRDVHRPLRGLGAPRRTRAGGRPRDRSGRALPADLPHAGHGTVGAGQGRRGGPDLRRRGRRGADAGQLPGTRVAPLQPLVRGVHGRRRRARVRDRDGERGDSQTRLDDSLDLGPRRVGARDGAARDRRGEGGRGSAARIDRGRRAAADPRRLEGIRSRVADPLLPRGRQATRRPRRAAAAAAACAEAVGLPMAAAIAARASRRALARGRRCRRRGRAGTRLGRRLSRMPAASSMPPSRARSPDARWRRRANASAPRPSWKRRLRRSRRSAARATRPQPSASCASSGGASTTARDRARRTRSGCESLSERELEVARLIVDRKTNPQIAAALFLSQKTVESHIRNMFRKLAVSSRVELARAVEQADRPR